MYPWYSMEIPEDARLPLDDRIAIQHLYGPNEKDMKGAGIYNLHTYTKFKDIA